MSLPDGAEYWWDVKGWNYDGSRKKQGPSKPPPPPVHYDDTGKGDHFCRSGRETDPVSRFRPSRGNYEVTCRNCRKAVHRTNLKCEIVRKWEETFPLRGKDVLTVADVLQSLPEPKQMPAPLTQPHPVICPYCNHPAVLVDSAEVYNGKSYGPIYLCRRDRAWVGCHKGTNTPLGRLADAKLRGAKKAAHAAFDPHWRGDLTPGARGRAYQRLAEALQIPLDRCHIGMFDVDSCQKVIEVCNSWKK